MKIDKNAKRGKPLIIALSAVILIAAVIAGGILIGLSSVNDFTAAARAFGMEITAGELKAQMSRDRAAALSYFTEKYGAEVDKSFWNRDFEGTTPNEYLRDYALKNLKRTKLVQKLATEYGLASENDVSYRGFLRNFQNENAERQSKKDGGEVIYGQTQYSEDTYFNYVISNLELGLQEKMSEKGEPLYASEGELKAFYEAEKATRYPKTDSYTFDAFTINYAGGDEDSKLTERAAYKQAKTARRLLSGDDYKRKIAERCADGKYRRLTLDDENASSIQKSTPAMFRAAQPLKKGEISEIIEERFSFSVLKCMSRKPGGYKDFEQYKSAIAKEYAALSLDNYITAQCNKNKAEKTNAYNKIELQ